MPSPQLTGPELAPESGTVKRAVILLHGVGSNGDDLIALAPMLAPALPDTHFLSPNAPFAFDQAPFGFQWFSLRDRSQPVRLEGVRLAAPILDAYIEQVKLRFGLRDDQIALVGFSQGTMTALYAGLHRPHALAAIVGFSGMLVEDDVPFANATPVCLIHGERDEVLPFAALAHAEAALKAAKVPVETHGRPYLGHSIDGEGLDAAVTFLQRAFGL